MLSIEEYLRVKMTPENELGRKEFFEKWNKDLAKIIELCYTDSKEFCIEWMFRRKSVLRKVFSECIKTYKVIPFNIIAEIEHFYQQLSTSEADDTA